VPVAGAAADSIYGNKKSPGSRFEGQVKVPLCGEMKKDGASRVILIMNMKKSLKNGQFPDASVVRIRPSVSPPCRI
jgi:hypothetical protein